MLLWMLACTLDLDDLDRDGYPTPQDCDDADHGINPAAVDIVGDGVDQDCDGVDPTIEVQGELHQCALEAGRIVCEGDNGAGQLEAPVGDEWVALASGALHSCALSLDGSVACWGDDRYGQASPPNLRDATWLGATRWASLAEIDGTVVCWGLCRVR